MTQEQEQVIRKNSNGNEIKRAGLDVPEHEVVQENADGSTEN